MRWRLTEKWNFVEVSKLLKLAGPLIVSNLAFTLLGSMDTIFMGRVGAAELGAVGVGATLFLAASTIFRSTAGFTLIGISQAYGEGNKEKIRQGFQKYLWFAFALAPITLLLPILFRAYFSITRPEETIKLLALTYMSIRVLELPFSLLSKIISSFMLGIGNSKTPMIVSWLTVIMKVILNFALVTGNFGFPKLGLAGAAWATVMAQAIEFIIYAVIAMRMYNKEYQLTQSWVRVSVTDLKTIFKLGFPMGVADSVDIFTFGILMTTISRFGAVDLAASQIANQLNDFAFMASFAIGTATGSLVGRSLGEGNTDKAERYGRLGMVAGASFMGFVGLGYWLVPKLFILPFTTDREVFGLAKHILKVIAVYQVLDVVYGVLRGALNGARQSRFTGFSTAICVIGVFAPVLYLATAVFEFGVWGAWSAPIIYVACLVTLLGSKFRDGLWKEPWRRKLPKKITKPKELSFEV